MKSIFQRGVTFLGVLRDWLSLMSSTLNGICFNAALTMNSRHPSLCHTFLICAHTYLNFECISTVSVSIMTDDFLILMNHTKLKVL